MKLIITIISILFISLLSSPSWSDTLTMDDLVERDNFFYKKFTDVPFTGEISGLENGNFRNGKHEGLWIQYHENGQLRRKSNFKDGKLEGLYELYHENGQLSNKVNYKDDKKEGLWEYFNKDGTIKNTRNYKDGKVVN